MSVCWAKFIIFWGKFNMSRNFYDWRSLTHQPKDFEIIFCGKFTMMSPTIKARINVMTQMITHLLNSGQIINFNDRKGFEYHLNDVSGRLQKLMKSNKD